MEGLRDANKRFRRWSTPRRTSCRPSVPTSTRRSVSGVSWTGLTFLATRFTSLRPIGTSGPKWDTRDFAFVYNRGSPARLGCLPPFFVVLLSFSWTQTPQIEELGMNPMLVANSSVAIRGKYMQTNRSSDLCILLLYCLACEKRLPHQGYRRGSKKGPEHRAPSRAAADLGGRITCLRCPILRGRQ